MSISRSAQIRWHLAIMLIQNPSLRQYRGHFLRSRTIPMKRIAKALFLNPVPTTIAGGFEIGRVEDDEKQGIIMIFFLFFFFFFFFFWTFSLFFFF